MHMHKKHLILLTGALLLSGSQVLAGPNDFFGGGTPGAASPVDPTAAAPMAPPGDYSEDEKRMQKKYKLSMRHAEDLIAKGKDMMEKGEAKRDLKMQKKGQIFKEIGEKQLAELQNNNPFENIKDRKEKASNPNQL